MFDLSDQQKDIRRAAREFAEGEFPKVAQDCDEKEIFPTDLWKKAGQSGFIGVFIDERYGGGGLGMLEYALLLEEFWRVDPGCGNVLLSTLGSELICDDGSKEQKAAWLPPLTKATAIMGAVACGHELHQEFHYATSNDKEYVVNGASRMVVNGASASNLVVFARDSASTGALSAFVVESWRDGVTTTRLSEKLGVRASDLSEVVFTDVAVPRSNVIGAEGHGTRQIGTFLDRLSIYHSAQAIGASRGCLERAVKYSRQRRQFGRPIGWFHMVQLKIGEIATRIDAAQYLCYRAAGEFDRGKADPQTLSMASWFSRETASLAAAETLQIHGGYGYMKDLDVERFYRDVQFLELFGASRENEKMRTAQTLLGKLD